MVTENTGEQRAGEAAAAACLQGIGGTAVTADSPQPSSWCACLPLGFSRNYRADAGIAW